MEYFHGFSSHGPSFRIIDELKPFMEPGEKEMMEQMEAMMNMIEMMQGMQEMCIRDRSIEGHLLSSLIAPLPQQQFNLYISRIWIFGQV